MIIEDVGNAQAEALGNGAPHIPFPQHSTPLPPPTAVEEGWGVGRGAPGGEFPRARQTAGPLAVKTTGSN